MLPADKLDPASATLASSRRPVDSGAWFRGTRVRHEGRIQAGGIHKNVTFVDADPDLNDQIRRRPPHHVPPLRRKHRQPRYKSGGTIATIKRVPRRLFGSAPTKDVARLRQETQLSV